MAALPKKKRRRCKGVKRKDALSSRKSTISFIPTGCRLLDNALGGGYADGRIINIVGDKSTGKTLLAIEACANFAAKHKKGLIRYKEAEAAFDVAYAEVLGLPVDRVEIEEVFDTVEDLQKDLLEFAGRCKKAGQSGIYVVDSLDALSDKAEQAKDIEKGTYGTAKARILSEMFRRNTRRLKESGITVLIISQIRDKLNVTFGRKTTRSGGRALDFYASQIIYLAEKKKITKTVKKIARPIGIEVAAKVDKNKVGFPFRTADFHLLFGYGVDDLRSSLEWLSAVNELDRVGITKTKIPTVIKQTAKMKPSERKALFEKVNKAVDKVWDEIEEGFMPQRRKYE